VACTKPDTRLVPCRDFRFNAKSPRHQGAAIDSFYVQETGGGKILHLERQKAIEGRLRHAIHQLDAAGG
jgi:hypothetical protein